MFNVYRTTAIEEQNFVADTDLYKFTHWMQIPGNVTQMHSYAESRGITAGTLPENAMLRYAGITAYLKQYMEGRVVTKEKIYEASKISEEAFGTKDYFNHEGWHIICEEYDGRLPLQIKSLAEGSLVMPKVPLLTIENIEHSRVPWLAGHTESPLLRAVWFGTTVCSLSYNIKQLISKYCEKTGCEVSPFHLNDFCLRGVSSRESSGLTGMPHLMNFSGTDNVDGIRAAKKYFNAGACGFSVCATEHSTTTVWGRHGEAAAVGNLLEKLRDGTVGAMVIDSYSSDNFVTNIAGKTHHDKIKNRKGKTVFRPDSGVPWIESVKICQLLMDAFSYTVNEKGFKVLPENIGIIYGDGINYFSIEKILEAFVAAGFCVSNIIFGMGGRLGQAGIDRDVLKFALKCSAAKKNGVWEEVYKDPATDSVKKSKRGRIATIRNAEGILEYCPESELNGRENMLKLMFDTGRVLNTKEWDEVVNTY